MTTTRSLSFLLALGILAPATARAQLVQEFQPPKADCCLQFSAQRLADELQDWNQLGRYYADDARLVAAGAVKGRVGAVIDNGRMKAEGQAKELKGEARQRANR